MIIDVRSPKEFAHAHIPGACNLPLLLDCEREQVGILYKQKSPQAAFDLALRFVAPRLEVLLTQAKQFKAPLKLYCWRGGMRSQSLTRLFVQTGLKSTILQGGYKAYRRWVLAFLQTDFPFQVLTGLTGSGKTERLHELKEQGEQTLDFEALANHKGSVFGYLGPQPSNEHFENCIASILNAFSLEKPIWVEDESRLVGACKIPDPIYEQMRYAPMFEVRCSKEKRFERLLDEYGSIKPNDLIHATKRLQKRLGSERTGQVIKAIEDADVKTALELILSYYDRTYEASLKKKLPSEATKRVVLRRG